MFTKILEKINSFIENKKLQKQLSIARSKTNLEQEKKIYDFLYSNLVLEDFVQLTEHNLLNINHDDYIFNSLSFQNIIDILLNEEVYQLDSTTNMLNIGSGAGQIAILTTLFYNFQNIIGIESSYEMYLLAKDRLKKFRESEYSKQEHVQFLNVDPLAPDFSLYNFIVVDYSNKNVLFNEMLQEKIKQECSSGTLIIKLVDCLREDKHIKLIKKLTLQNEENKDFFVYFYKVKN